MAKNFVYGTCSICNIETKVLLRKKTKTFVCPKCYVEFMLPKKICYVCNFEKKIYKYIDGEPICFSCFKYKAPKRKCSICGNVRKITIKEKQICINCYKKVHNSPKKICYICGQLSCVEMYDINNMPICKKCYKKIHKLPKEKCSCCGEERIVQQRLNGKPICIKCYKRPCAECSICKKFKPIETRIESKEVCKSCHMSWKLKYDEKFYIKNLLRKRLVYVLWMFSKNGKICSSKKYGIDYEEIIKHLGPCPGNRNEYHIDHIFPLSAFDLDNPLHVKIAFAPENHQWLKAKENLIKNDKYDKILFNEYLERKLKEK